MAGIGFDHARTLAVAAEVHPGFGKVVRVQNDVVQVVLGRNTLHVAPREMLTAFGSQFSVDAPTTVTRTLAGKMVEGVGGVANLGGSPTQVEAFVHNGVIALVMYEPQDAAAVSALVEPMLASAHSR